MSPAELFTLAGVITLVGVIWEAVSRKMRHKRLGKLAAEWQMNYSPIDQFRLTSRVGGISPSPARPTLMWWI